MMSGFGWAKNPMIKRMNQIRDDIPITILYGSRSWVDNSAGEAIKDTGHHNYVNVQIITGAGHHVYADKPEIFNRYVNDACNLTDNLDKTIAIRNTTTTSKNEKTESDQEDDAIPIVDNKRAITDGRQENIENDTKTTR